MKKDVLINIRGIYNIEEQEEDVIELFTNGTYCKEDGNYIIRYEESSATGYEGCTTTLTIEKIEDTHRVTMSRSGEVNTLLVIQNGTRHQGLYDIGHGDMMIGVSGLAVRSTLGDTGGSVNFKYALDVNAVEASQNEMTIEIKENNPDVM